MLHRTHRLASPMPRIHAADLDIHYRTAGDGEPVVCLHGSHALLPEAPQAVADALAGLVAA